MMLTISSRPCKRYMLTEDRQQPRIYPIRRDLRVIPIQNLQFAWTDLNANHPRFGRMGRVIMNREAQIILHHGLHHATRMRDMALSKWWMVISRSM